MCAYTILIKETREKDNARLPNSTSFMMQNQQILANIAKSRRGISSLGKGQGQPAALLRGCWHLKTQPRRTAAVSSCWRRAVRRTEWRWRSGASFRSCHLRVCGTGWRRGLAAAAGATSLFGLSSPSSPFPPQSAIAAHPCALSARRGSWRREEGAVGAGEACGWTRVRRHLLQDPCVPAPRRLASRASADAAVTAGRGSLRGGRGCPTVAGTAVRAPSCGAGLFPT